MNKFVVFFNQSTSLRKCCGAKLCDVWALAAPNVLLTSTVWWEFYNLTFSTPAAGLCFIYTLTYSHTHTHSLFLCIISHGFLQGRRFLRMVFNNHSNKWLHSYCFMALLRCTRGSQSRAVSKSTGISCVSVSHEVLHLFPSLRREHSCPRLSTHTQFTKHNSQIPCKRGERLNQSVKHLPHKHNHRTHSSFTLLLADSSPL